MISCIIFRRELVLESEAGLNIYHEATLGLQFLTSFPHSNKSTYDLVPKGVHENRTKGVENKVDDTLKLVVFLECAQC